MINHSSGADRFRSLTGDEAYRSQLISRNQPPIIYHSSDFQWKRLRALARRIMGFIASQRVAVVASRTRRLQGQPNVRRYDRKPVWTADRSRS